MFIRGLQKFKQEGQQDSSVGKVLAPQAWQPEFQLHHIKVSGECPLHSWSLHIHYYVHTHKILHSFPCTTKTKLFIIYLIESCNFS